MKFKPIAEYSLEEIMAMTDNERKELEKRTLSSEMDYIFSQNVIDSGFLRRFKPEDFDTFLDEGQTPDSLVLIASELGDEIYIMTTTDFLPESRMQEQENSAMIIESFENGLPTWLHPKKGIQYYLGEWIEDAWKFIEYAKI